ncbi:MAG: PGF-pre-PGF domain-containing protein [Bacteroidales bacterium]|nr:PGF-pre-PGF domain-containing protein [Bacteroidales bacterium]
MNAINNLGNDRENKSAYITVHQPILINETNPTGDVVTSYGESRVFSINTNYGNDCDVSWYLDGSKVSESSLVYTTGTDVPAGSHTVSVEVSSEKYGTAQQTWNWFVYTPISIFNFLPSLNPVSAEGKSPLFKIEANQKCTIKWYLNEALVDSTTDVNSDTYQNNSLPVGAYNVTAVAENNYDSSQVIWNWTILQALKINSFSPQGDYRSLVDTSGNFSIGLNQDCNISWYIDDVLKLTESEKNSSIFTNTLTTPGTFNVKAVANNSVEELNRIWAWKVLDYVSIDSRSPESDPSVLKGISPDFTVNTNQNCTIKWYIDGGLVDTVDNVTSDTYRNTTLLPGNYNLTAVADNGYDSKKTGWNWKVLEYVSIDSRFPESDPATLEGDSPDFTVNMNQNCTIKWYIDGELVDTVDYADSDTYRNTTLLPGNYNLTAVADNGYDSKKTGWNWTVLPHLEVIDFNPPKEHQYSVLNKTQAFSIELNQEGNVSWFINDTEVRSENNVNSSTYKNESSRLGNHTVKAVIKTEFEEINHTWTWTVVDAFAIMTRNPEQDPVSVAGKTRMFRIDTNQPCNVSWKVNDVEVSFNNSVDFSTCNLSRSTAEIYTVEARAENKFGNDSCNWTWTVVEALEIKSPSPETNPATANGSVQPFSIDVNRPCNISWYLDETEVAGENSKEYKPIGTVGPHNVTVIITNATTEEKCSHQWDWTVFEPVSIVARSEADPVSIEGKSPEFRIEANQNCTVKWYLNEALVYTGTNVIIDTYQNDSLPAGSYNVTAVADNSYDSKQVVWNWTVIETLKISEYFPTADPISIHGEARQFNVTTNRPSNISWYIDNVKVKGPINNIKEDNYTNNTALPWNHTVEVVAENGTEKVNHTWTWSIDPEPVQANFSVNVSKGVAPLTVNFTDLSENATAWLWDFGDGKNSTYPNPVYTFNESGCYNVSLNASNEWVSNLSKLQIVVTEKIESSLSVGKNTTIENKSIKFKVEGNISVTDGNRTLRIKNDGMNLSIHSDEGFQNNSGNWSGNYSHAELEKEPENFTLGGEFGDIEVSFNASLKNNLSNLNNANITTTVVPGVPENVNETDFQLVARNFAEGKVDILYSMSIEKKGLEGTEVKDAWIVMSLPATYVNKSVNGPNDFKIMSLHDGEVTTLETSWTLDTKRSVYVFKALSPKGFSVKALVHYTPKVVTPAPGPSGSGGGSNGGGMAGSGENAKNIKLKEICQRFMSNGNHVEYTFMNVQNPIMVVEFDPLRSYGKVTAAVEVLNEKSARVSTNPKGMIYQYMNIEVGTAGMATSENIENAVVSFRVNKSWIKENEIDQSTVSLCRYSEEQWNALPTNVTGEDDEYVYFEASTPGFSPFAVIAEEPGIEIIPKPEKTETNTETHSEVSTKQDNETGNESDKNGIPGFELAFAALGLLGSAMLVRRNRFR